jgi:hypothetical protein
MFQQNGSSTYVIFQQIILQQTFNGFASWTVLSPLIDRTAGLLIDLAIYINMYNSIYRILQGHAVIVPYVKRLRNF